MAIVKSTPTLKTAKNKDSFIEKIESYGYVLVKDTGFYERKVNDSSSFSINKEMVNGNCIVTFTMLHNTQFALLSTSMVMAVNLNDFDKSLVDQMEKLVTAGIEGMMKTISLSKEEEKEQKI